MEKLFIFLSTVMFSSGIFAQESKVSMGLQVVPSISGIRFTRGDLDSRFVISSGISFDYNISQNLSFNSGLAFERIGAKLEFYPLDNLGNRIGLQKVKYNYNYLTLPLIATYNTNRKVNYYVGGGTFVGFLITQETFVSAVGVFPAQIKNNTDVTKKVNMGLSFITGINISMADKLILDMGLRDYLGLTNTNIKRLENTNTYKTNSFSLVLGLKYRI